MLNVFQLIVLLCSVFSALLSLTAIWMVIRSPDLKLKPLWILGSLIGFVGLGINWTVPDDIVLQFGFSIPPVRIFKILANDHVVVQALFPIVALLAILKVTSPKQLETEIFD